MLSSYLKPTREKVSAKFRVLFRLDLKSITLTSKQNVCLNSSINNVPACYSIDP